MRRLAEACVDFGIRHVATLGVQPASGLEDASEVAAWLRAPHAPEEPRGLEEALAVLAEAVPRSLNSAGPGYLAYIPGGGLFASALADFMASCFNRYTGAWGTAPALVQLEANVIRWLAGWIDYGPEAFGTLTSGGSLANFAATVTARVHGLGEDLAGGVAYTTAEAHHSVAKALWLAGLPRSSLRVQPGLRMDVDALRAAVAEDRAAGRRPFLVVAQAGSTNTGSVDPLADLADLCQREGLWLHVDAAYGGFFVLTERGRAVLRGIERADSVTLDPHKGLFLPYCTGCVLVRRGDLLRRAHAVDASYLQDLDEAAHPSFTDYSAEQSRAFRGLRVWLPLMLHGTRAFREALDEKLDLARHAWRRLSDAGCFEMLDEPALSVVAFRLRADDDANRRLLELVNGEKRVFLSSTRIEDRYTLRLCVFSFRSHQDHVDDAVDSLTRNARSILTGSTS